MLYEFCFHEDGKNDKKTLVRRGIGLFLMFPSFTYNPGPVTSAEADENPDKDTDNETEGHIDRKSLVGDR